MHEVFYTRSSDVYMEVISWLQSDLGELYGPSVRSGKIQFCFSSAYLKDGVEIKTMKEYTALMRNTIRALRDEAKESKPKNKIERTLPNAAIMELWRNKSNV
ncbi:MAG: hypothetical protein HYW24_04540 [Candidatus Aenigmarchaeota archaeon]|nr:hypothetical protein [Candidatus Aenigmarchaeota archaeon]